MMTKGKKILIAAAAIAVLGTMTVIAAGKIASYHSSINRDQVDYENAAQLSEAEATLGALPKAPQQFSNGLSFDAGYLQIVEGMDENDNIVESNPTVMIDYGNTVYLNISNSSGEGSSDSEPVSLKEIDGIQLKAFSIDYLFLPPGAAPSAEDEALAAEGKLNISYGSIEEERSSYHYVIWVRDGLAYNLSSFNQEYGVETLMDMAEEVIAVE